MSIEIRVDRDPHNDGVPLFEGTNVRVKPGWTSLLGCTGSGRTSLLNVIENKLRSHFKAEYLEDYLLLDDTEAKAVKYVVCKWDLLAAGQWIIKEPILFRPPWLYRDMVRSVSDKLQYGIDRIKELSATTEIVVLLDNFDIDVDTFRVSEFKFLMTKQLEQLSKQMYLIVTANSYDLVAIHSNLWVNNFRYYTFKSELDYKRLIEASVAKCNNRIEKIHDRDKILMKPVKSALPIGEKNEGFI